MILRDYQAKAVDAVLDELKDNGSTLLVMATGLGKTIAFANVIHRMKDRGRSLVVAHRQELIDQAVDKIEKATLLRADVEMGDRWSSESNLLDRAEVVVSSVQTQIAGFGGSGRMTRFDPNDFGLGVIDEAHHAPASSYRRVIDYYKNNPQMRWLGVTATPDRADEAALGQIFDSVAYVYEINDGIKDGWLVPIQQRAVYVDGLDFSQARTTAGDLNGADLARIMEQEENLHEIATPTLELTAGRKSLVFTASLFHAERLTEILNRHDPDCARWVHGGTPKDERRKLFADYAAGRFRILCNVGVATEGFDEPSIECVVMARPTKSRALYAQMVGRGTRPLAGVVDGAENRTQAIAESPKPYLEIIDFAGNSGKHKLMSAADILGGEYSEDVIQRAELNAKKRGTRKPADVMLELKKAAAQIEKELEAARRRRIKAAATYKTKAVDPFDVLAISPRRERGWDKGRKPSDKMVRCLERFGVEVKPDLSFANARHLIQQLIGRAEKKLCTYKQAKLLKRYGYVTKDITFERAGQLITAIKNNGWKKPKAVA